MISLFIAVVKRKWHGYLLCLLMKKILLIFVPGVIEFSPVSAHARVLSVRLIGGLGHSQCLLCPPVRVKFLHRQLACK